MMPEYKISIEIQPESKEVDFVDKQLHEFNVGKIRPLAKVLFARGGKREKVKG
ncbi:hypothetical protein [Nostoc sp. C117]|uniref:hypothetical protein n=1 Tax=Nostoc sp. C117 TaxID=3349875 RepID=UPI00370D10CC